MSEKKILLFNSFKKGLIKFQFAWSFSSFQGLIVADCHPAVVCAVRALAGLVVGKSLQEIVSDFRGFYRLLSSDGQMRWVRASAQAGKESDGEKRVSFPASLLALVTFFFSHLAVFIISGIHSYLN